MSELADELADEIVARLLAREAPRPALAAPRPPSLSPPASLGTPPSVEAAVLRHPAVLQALQLRDSEVIRLRQALIAAVGREEARDHILGAAGASRGPVFLGAAAAPVAPPPWAGL